MRAHHQQAEVAEAEEAVMRVHHQEAEVVEVEEEVHLLKPQLLLLSQLLLEELVEEVEVGVRVSEVDRG